MAPEIRYATAPDGARIAYSTLGDGPGDLLYVPQSISGLELMWDHPTVSAFFERLGSFARLIAFDRRGSGLSSRRGAPAPLEGQIDDVKAVLDAAGSRRAAVFALMEGGPMAMMLAASAPERVSELVLYASFARVLWDEDYEWAPTAEQRASSIRWAIEDWGTGDLMLANFAPNYANDVRLREWIGRLQRRAMSPDEWEVAYELNGRLDLRSILPSIRVPTLVLHRRDDHAINPMHSGYVAKHVPGAKLIELPGVDSLPFLGDSEAVLGEIEEFITGSRHSWQPDRVLATVLFTDICDSTRRAAAMGDRDWRTLLTQHHEDVRRRVSSQGGREIKTVGDGVLATFDGPARAVRAAMGIVDDASRHALEVRAGLHTGEVEVMGDDVGGLAVHIGARVSAAAAPCEVLVSGTVKDLVVGSGLAFSERGVHELKGVPGEWALWAAQG